MAGNTRDRSVSGGLDDDSDLESQGHHDESNDNPPAGKPGRKKNPNSQAARRDQNRIAQREFRLRKQQRIRDLEASVELLSGGKDEALTQLRKIMKDLMQENQVLRQLLRSLSGFIGDGAGGLLPKLGWDMNDFNNFINRSETDTAWESYQRHKRDGQAASGSGSSSSTLKRPSEDDGSAQAKRARGQSDATTEDRPDYPLLVPVNNTVPPLPPNGIYPNPAPRSHENMINDLLRAQNGGSPMFVPPTSPPSSQFGPSPNSVGSTHSPYQPPYMASMNVNVDPSLPNMSIVSGSSVPMSATRVVPQPPQAPEPAQASSSEDSDQEPKRLEAYKLIHYHLDNYKRNSAYCLPASLRPTLVQRTIQHESVIDSILHPELRDRMILLRGRFDLVDCLHDYRSSITIHGDDVLAHQNWEISESWLQRYKFLVDVATLNIVNRWRRERGEAELHASDYAAPDATNSSS